MTGSSIAKMREGVSHLSVVQRGVETFLGPLSMWESWSSTGRTTPSEGPLCLRCTGILINVESVPRRQEVRMTGED